MKIATRFLCSNWGYISHDVFAVAPCLTLLTGENGSGKSTINDAFQAILLGSFDKKYFNKAANQNSERTFLSYARGQKSINDGVPIYHRNYDFTTHLIIELLDTEANKHFCIGVIVDVTYSTGDTQTLWFALPSGIPEDEFIIDGHSASIADFKKQYINNLNGTVFVNSKDFNLHMRSRKYLGDISDDFKTLFPNAVAFQPPNSMDDFIEKFLCENIDIDVNDLKQNIYSYKALEDTARKITHQIDLLADLSYKYANFSSLLDKIKLNNFKIKLCDKLDFEKQIKQYQDTIINSTQTINVLEKEKEKLNLRMEEIKGDIRSALESLGKAKADSGIIELDNAINNINNKLKSLENLKKALPIFM